MEISSDLDTVAISAGGALVIMGGGLILGWKRELRRPDHGWRQSALYWVFLFAGGALLAWRGPDAFRRLAAYWRENWADQDPRWQLGVIGLIAITSVFAAAGVGALGRREQLAARRRGQKAARPWTGGAPITKIIALVWSGEHRAYDDQLLSRLVLVFRVSSALLGVIFAGLLLLSLASM